MSSDKQIEFFLNSPSTVIELDLLQISHPFFTKTYRIVRNAVEGLMMPNGDFYQYLPVEITTLTTGNNMDYAIKVTLGDLSEILPPEIKSLQASDSLDIEPKVDHFVYRHDDLSEPLATSLNLHLADFNFNSVNSFFTAKAPTINNTKTGRPYSVEDFPMMKAFLL